MNTSPPGHSLLILPVLLFVISLCSVAEEPAAKKEPAKDTQTILTSVSELMARREYPAALALFNQINQEDAQSTEIQLLRASLLNSAGRPAEARAIAQGIVSGEPNNIDALLVLASSAAAEGKDREQRTMLERVIKLDSKNVKALSDLGYIALRAQSLRSAGNYFDRALAVNGEYGEALVGRAIAHRYSREPKKSEQLLNKAIRLYPQWAIPLNERARLYKGAGYQEDALRDLDAAKKLEPDNYWITVDRGATLVELNRKPEALEEFNRAIALDQNNFLAYVYRAGIKDEAGDYAGAEQDYLVLMKLKPEYYFAAEGLGLIKMRNKQWAEARDAFLAAYKQAPKEYGYALLAVINWIKAGRITDPKQFLAQVLRTVPRDSVEWYMLKLYHDLSGDSDAAVRIDKEKNLDAKARMLFYLANYYDIRGNKILADTYFLQVQELQRTAIFEWRINEWLLNDRGIKGFTE
jgi:tetratricopeptide (TPR) repeat protein